MKLGAGFVGLTRSVRGTVGPRAEGRDGSTSPHRQQGEDRGADGRLRGGPASSTRPRASLGPAPDPAPAWPTAPVVRLVRLLRVLSLWQRHREWRPLSRGAAGARGVQTYGEIRPAVGCLSCDSMMFFSFDLTGRSPGWGWGGACILGRPGACLWPLL